MQQASRWFEDRWNDRWCLDISEELVANHRRELGARGLIPPYHIYVKMAYHLSQEARAGLSEFRIPRDFGDKLFDFQTAAVKIAAHHLNKRNGVLIGDVVGLGKTLMATALARIFEDDHDLETLIICPKNLYRCGKTTAIISLAARVLSISQASGELADLRRYRLVVIDESHNLRNREGSATARFRNTSRQMKASASCSRRRLTTRPTLTSPTSCVCLSRKIRSSASGRKSCCAKSAKPSSSAAINAGTIAGGIRKERVRG